MGLLLLALAPVVVILIYIYVKDKYEKEPIGLLVKNFLLGAIVSIIITVVLGFAANIIFPVTDEKDIFQQFVIAFFVVALVEEFSKYIIVKYY